MRPDSCLLEARDIVDHSLWVFWPCLQKNDNENENRNIKNQKNIRHSTIMIYQLAYIFFLLSISCKFKGGITSGLSEKLVC